MRQDALLGGEVGGCSKAYSGYLNRFGSDSG